MRSPTSVAGKTDPANVVILNWRDWLNPRAGGAENYLHGLAVELQKRGCDVSWVSQRPTGSPRREVCDGIVVVRAGNPVTGYLFAPRAFREVAGDPSNVLTIESVNTIPFASRLYSKSVIIMVHHIAGKELLTELPFPISAILYALERCSPLIHRGRTVLTISDQSREELLSLGYARIA